jgi:Putative addiction module component
MGVLSSIEEYDEAVAAAWADELERRSREITEGRIQPVDWDTAGAELEGTRPAACGFFILKPRSSCASAALFLALTGRALKAQGTGVRHESGKRPQRDFRRMDFRLNSACF